MRITNDFPTSLPDSTRPAKDWTLEEGCAFVGRFFETLTNAINFASVRIAGYDRYVARDRAMVRAHQERYFLDGVRKLGIGGEPPAVLAANYHLLSNALGGVRMRGAVESPEKAWFFYLPFTGSPAYAFETEAIPLADYTAWHARNGELLGNPGLVVVITHMHARGDPYHGGYFLDTGTASVPVADRCRTSWGEQPPELVSPDFDEREWPDERRFRALRNFWRDWADSCATSSLQSFGHDGYHVVRSGFETVLYSWSPLLEAAFPAEAPHEPPAGRFARIFSGLHQLANRCPETADDGAATRVEVQKSLLSIDKSDLSREQVSRADRATKEAWDGLAALFGARVEVEFGPDGSAWRFY